MDFGKPFGGIISGAQAAALSVLLRTGTALTGRQVHLLVGSDWSLWSVQEALKVLERLGVVMTVRVGRAQLHSINEEHFAAGPLRALSDPMGVLTATIRESVDEHVRAVILFGSLARGDADGDSDIDLAVIADPGWDGRVELADRVSVRLGNACDVLVFEPEEYVRLVRQHEPVVTELAREGIALVGVKPVVASVMAG